MSIKLLHHEKFNECLVMVTIDKSGYHCSASAEGRCPTFDEMKEIQDKYLPNDKVFIIIFPPPNLRLSGPNKFVVHMEEMMPPQLAEIIIKRFTTTKEAVDNLRKKSVN